MKNLHRAYDIARARLYYRLNGKLTNIDKDIGDLTMSRTSLYDYFRENQQAKPKNTDSTQELQAEVDRLQKALLGLGSLTELETIKDCGYNTLKVMSALGVSEEVAKEKISICRLKATNEEMVYAKELYKRFHNLITDEQINRYIPEYQEEARNKLIVLAYIDSVIFDRVQCTKDTVALAKYEARKIRAIRKKSSTTAEQASTRATETTATSRLSSFQKKMRS